MLVAGLGIIPAHCQSQESLLSRNTLATDGKSEIPLLKREVVLRPKIIPGRGSDRVLLGEFALGNLEAGKRYRVELQVENPTEDELLFSRAIASCGCLKFEIENSSVPALGSSGMVFYIDTPQRLDKVSVRSSVRFVDRTTNNDMFSLLFSYDLQNMFNIVGDRLVVEVPQQGPDSSVTVRVPLLISPPLSLHNLEVATSDNLRDIAATLTKGNDDNCFIEIIVHRQSVINSAIAGDLYVRRKGATDSDSISVVVRLQAPVSIRPETVRFVKSQPDGPYHAKAILRVRNALEQRSEDSSETAQKSVSPTVELMINGSRATVDLKKLGNSGIYSVSIRFDGPLPNKFDDSFPAKWAIRGTGSENVIETTVFFED